MEEELHLLVWSRKCNRPKKRVGGRKGKRRRRRGWGREAALGQPHRIHLLLHLHVRGARQHLAVPNNGLRKWGRGFFDPLPHCSSFDWASEFFEYMHIYIYIYIYILAYNIINILAIFSHGITFEKTNCQRGDLNMRRRFQSTALLSDILIW